MSAFNDAWTLLKQQMSLLPFGFATGNPAQDALAYLGAGPGTQEGAMTVPYADEYASYQDFLSRQKPYIMAPQYELDVSRSESGYRGNQVGLNPYLTADGETVGKFPMAPTDTRNLRRDITRGRGRDVIAHTSMPVDELITDFDGKPHFIDSTTAIPELAFYPTGSEVDSEHRGKGLYIRSLLSLLSTPEAMGLSAKDVAREDVQGGFNDFPGEGRGFNLSDVDPPLFNELYGQRGLMSPPSRSSGKGGSDRSHRLLSERYKKIMDLLGEDIHTYGEGQSLSNIVDMAERGEGMFRTHGGKLKHNLLEGSFGELRNPDTLEELKGPRGKTFFYDPIPVDVGKNPLEQETFGDLRRFDLAGLPVRVRQMRPQNRHKRLKQTSLDRFVQPDIDEMYPPIDSPQPSPPPSRPRSRAFARQQAQRHQERVQEAIDSLGGLFSSGQVDLGEVTRDAILEGMTGEGFNETFENSDRDTGIKESLKYLDEHIGKRHYDEHGFAHPSPFDNLPKNMQINLGRDVQFLEDMQNQNSRSDGVREALRRAEEEDDRVPVWAEGLFDPKEPAQNTVGLGALRQNIIFEEIDKAITRVRIINHHLRTYPLELSGRAGRPEQQQAHALLRNHLDDLFHPIHGNMMDN